MRNHRHGEFLDLFRRDKVHSIEQRQRLRAFHQGNRCARARAELHAIGRARAADQVDDVMLQFLADANTLDGAFQVEQVRQRGARFEQLERMIVFLRGEDGYLVIRLHIAERELHREPVHLRLGQGIRPAKFHRVLRGDDEK